MPTRRIGQFQARSNFEHEWQIGLCGAPCHDPCCWMASCFFFPCVNYTMRDLLANWTNDPAQLVLLEDCASAVPGFEADADSFVADMKAAGCTVLSAGAVKL